MKIIKYFIKKAKCYKFMYYV